MGLAMLGTMFSLLLVVGSERADALTSCRDLARLRPRPEARAGRNAPPEEPTELVLFGEASFYHPSLHGRRTASGRIYRRTSLTAAHRDLPFGTVLRVTNLENGRRVVVEVNDRGPFVEDRILDLSEKAAGELDMLEAGVVEVKIEEVAATERAESRE